MSPFRTILAIGLVFVLAAHAVALPTGGQLIMHGHKQPLVFTSRLRLGELEQLKALPGDEAYDPQEIDDAIRVLSKHSCTGIILPDQVIEAFDGRRFLAPHGVVFFKRGEIELRPIISKPAK